MRFLLVLIALVLFSTPVAGEAPPETIFFSDFELGELDDRGKERITDPRFLKDWEQQFPSRRFPRFMAVSLVREPDLSGRHLAVPFLGARALVSSKAEVKLLDRQLLRFRARVRWDDLGEGHIQFRLSPEGGEPLVLYEGRGKKKDWEPIQADIVIPEGFGSARLEVLLKAQPGVKDGELEVDDVRLETVPRIVWGFRSALRKVDQGDEYPLAVSSVSYPTDTYELTFTVVDGHGREKFRESKILLVSEGYPIDYSPRLGRARGGLPRGIYTVTLTLKSRAGWGIVDERKIALSGRPPFAPRPGGVTWGFDFGSDRVAPEWLAEVKPSAVVLEFLPSDTVEAPDWLAQYPLCDVLAVLSDRAGWNEKNVLELAPLFTRIQRWFWSGQQSLGRPVLAALEKDAPFLRPGHDRVDLSKLPVTGELLTAVPTQLGLEELVSFGVPDRKWSARLNLGPVPEPERARTLARLLFVLATQSPTSVILEEPGEILVESSLAGGFVAREALLVWDFVTSFLSGSRYMGQEPWHEDAHCFVFRRQDRDYVVVLADSTIEGIRVPGGPRTSIYDRTGTQRELLVDQDGLVTLPVGRDPVVVAGLDLAAVRTARSITAMGAEDGEGNQRRITVNATNHYESSVRITLELTPPSNWETADRLPARTVESGARVEWPMIVTVPDWYGLGGPTVLEGTAILELENGNVVRLPLEVPVPMESGLVAIDPVRLESGEAEISVENRTAGPLRLNVHLQARPGDEEKTSVDVVLAAGDTRSFTLSYARASENEDVAELWVGVTVPEKKAYVNRVYRLPK